MNRGLEVCIHVRISRGDLISSCECFGTGEVEEVHAASCRVGKHARFFDRKSFGEWGSGRRILCKTAHVRIGLGTVDEDPQQLRLFAVKRKRDPAWRRSIDFGNLLHDLEEMSEVV